MNKMDRQVIRAMFDSRSQVCDVNKFNDVTKIGQETSPGNSHARRDRVSCVLNFSSGREK